MRKTPIAPSLSHQQYVALYDTWFPEGRNPWRDLYTPEVMNKLADTLGLTAEIEVFTLETRLCHTAEEFLVLMNENALAAPHRPIGLTYADRSKWLRKHIIQPVTALLTSLGRENRSYLSTFPNVEMRGLPSYPAFPYIEAELRALLDWATALADQFDIRMRCLEPDAEGTPALHVGNDLRYALVWQLLEIYVATPNHSRKEGPRVPSAQSAKVNRKQEKSGEFVAFVRMAAQPILNKVDLLTDHITLAIEKFKVANGAQTSRKF